MSRLNGSQFDFTQVRRLDSGASCAAAFDPSSVVDQGFFRATYIRSGIGKENIGPVEVLLLSCEVFTSDSIAICGLRNGRKILLFPCFNGNEFTSIKRHGNALSLHSANYQLILEASRLATAHDDTCKWARTFGRLCGSTHQASKDTLAGLGIDLDPRESHAISSSSSNFSHFAHEYGTNNYNQPIMKLGASNSRRSLIPSSRSSKSLKRLTIGLGDGGLAQDLAAMLNALGEDNGGDGSLFNSESPAKADSSVSQAMLNLSVSSKADDGDAIAMPNASENTSDLGRPAAPYTLNHSNSSASSLSSGPVEVSFEHSPETLFLSSGEIKNNEAPTRRFSRVSSILEKEQQQHLERYVRRSVLHKDSSMSSISSSFATSSRSEPPSIPLPVPVPMLATALETSEQSGTQKGVEAVEIADTTGAAQKANVLQSRMSVASTASKAVYASPKQILITKEENLPFTKNETANDMQEQMSSQQSIPQADTNNRVEQAKSVTVANDSHSHSHSGTEAEPASNQFPSRLSLFSGKENRRQEKSSDRGIPISDSKAAYADRIVKTKGVFKSVMQRLRPNKVRSFKGPGDMSPNPAKAMASLSQQMAANDENEGSGADKNTTVQKDSPSMDTVKLSDWSEAEEISVSNESENLGITAIVSSQLSQQPSSKSLQQSGSLPRLPSIPELLKEEDTPKVAQLEYQKREGPSSGSLAEMTGSISTSEYKLNSARGVSAAESDVSYGDTSISRDTTATSVASSTSADIGKAVKNATAVFTNTHDRKISETVSTSTISALSFRSARSFTSRAMSESNSNSSMRTAANNAGVAETTSGAASSDLTTSGNTATLKTGDAAASKVSATSGSSGEHTLPENSVKKSEQLPAGAGESENQSDASEAWQRFMNSIKSEAARQADEKARAEYQSKQRQEAQQRIQEKKQAELVEETRRRDEAKSLEEREKAHAKAVSSVAATHVRSLDPGSNSPFGFNRPADRVTSQPILRRVFDANKSMPSLSQSSSSTSGLSSSSVPNLVLSGAPGVQLSMFTGHMWVSKWTTNRWTPLSQLELATEVMVLAKGGARIIITNPGGVGTIGLKFNNSSEIRRAGVHDVEVRMREDVYMFRSRDSDLTQKLFTTLVSLQMDLRDPTTYPSKRVSRFSDACSASLSSTSSDSLEYRRRTYVPPVLSKNRYSTALPAIAMIGDR